MARRFSDLDAAHSRPSSAVQPRTASSTARAASAFRASTATLRSSIISSTSSAVPRSFVAKARDARARSW